MKFAVLAEQKAGERRVALTPPVVAKLRKIGADIHVEGGAGANVPIADDLYIAQGATIGSRADVLAGADVILCVRPPAPESLAGAKRGAILIGALEPYAQIDRVGAYAELGLEAMALELLPRTTRAQSMDILSSQANLAGYRAVLVGATQLSQCLPMMTTAAGTIAAARVFVMGVGVAGLQAIATARRLGAIVSATDVRPETREQILSLGAKPIFVEDEDSSATARNDGYAGETSDSYRARQAELVSNHIGTQDIVITTAQIPGRPAPRLISDAQVASMRPGSVIVDLAVDSGGNVEGARPNETVVRHGVSIVGAGDGASQLATDTSQLFARNLSNFIENFWDKEAKALRFPAEDALADAVRMTREGAIVHPNLVALKSAA